MGIVAWPKTLACIILFYGLLFVKQCHIGWEEPLWAPPAEGTAWWWHSLELLGVLLRELWNYAELFFLLGVIPLLYAYPLVYFRSASDSIDHKSLENELVNSPQSFMSYGIVTILASFHQFPLWTGDFQQGLLAVARTFFIWPVTLFTQMVWTGMICMALFDGMDDGKLASETKGSPEAVKVPSQGDLAAEDDMEKGVAGADDSDINVEPNLPKNDEKDVELEDGSKQTFKLSTIWKTSIDLQKHTAITGGCLFITFLTYLLYPAESPAKTEWTMLDLGYSWVSWWHRILVVLALVVAALNCMKLGGIKVVTACRG